MSWAERLYRLALHLYPARFRRRFGDDMVRAFRDGTRGALRRGGRTGVAVFWLRCGLDLCREAVAERWFAGTERESAHHIEQGGGGMESWWMDLRYALRGLRRRPALTVGAIVTLALGVGANTAIFSVVNGVLLRPFDMPEAERLVVAQDRSSQGGGPFRTTGGVFRDWREGNRTFQDMALLGGWSFNLTEAGLDPERVNGVQVTASYFDVVGVLPALGRVFRPEESQGRHRVVILSDALWRERYGADPDIVGRGIVADGERWEVVGVMPPVALPVTLNGLGLAPGDRERMAWVPLDLEPGWASGYQSHVFVALGRLQPGVSLEAASEDLAALTRAVSESHPETYTGITSDVAPLRTVVLGDARRDLLILLGAVGLVLLVACANLANLLLARTLDRSREMAVRAAVGAGAGRLVRLGLLEAVLLGLAGGVGGLVLASGGLDVLLAMLPEDLPRQSSIGVDGHVLLFTLGVALVAGVVVGLLPALRGARPRMTEALKAGGRGTAGSGGGRTARVLVAGQLALACTLLVGAGLLVRSFLAVRAVDLGARTRDLLSVELLLPSQGYGDRLETSDFLHRLEAAVEALPGVTSASVAYDTPLSASWTETFTVTDRPAPEPGQKPGAYFRPVSPGYFEALGIPLLRGRAFTEDDGPDAPGVVVVNQDFVDDNFAGEDPLGRRIRMTTMQGMWDASAPAEWEIVGVVGDVRFAGLRADAPDAFYFSQRQAPTTFLHLLVATRVPPRSVLAGVRATIAGLDSSLPLSAVTTLDEEYARATAQDRFNALLLLAFAVTALLVAAAGIYGVMSYAVARRRAEMGVRLALGAGPGRVRRLLLGEGLRMAGTGLLAGLAGAVLAGRLLSGLLFGVSAWDPTVMGGVFAILLSAAVLSAWLPALRAARTDPAVALREE